MKYVYFKPELRNLSQGERIAFVRQFRGFTQDNITEKLGITGENKRRTMTRYERGERSPKSDRLLELSKILNVNVNCIREYDFAKTDVCLFKCMLFYVEKKKSYKNFYELFLKEKIKKKDIFKYITN